MKILSIGKQIDHPAHRITYTTEAALQNQTDINDFDYLLISGGDGTLRRVIREVTENTPTVPPIILNPTGSFNVIAKLYRIPPCQTLLDRLAEKGTVETTPVKVYRLNREKFLFSAGNMGDLQHIFLSESLRFGWLKKGSLKYILSLLFLLPVHLIMTPFMLMSRQRFFVFIPLKVVKKLGSFHGEIEGIVEIDLKNGYNLIELDGDIVLIKESLLEIAPCGTVALATGR